jgi:hypothetical protein
MSTSSIRRTTRRMKCRRAGTKIDLHALCPSRSGD